jgi:hypothetical protein
MPGAGGGGSRKYFWMTITQMSILAVTGLAVCCVWVVVIVLWNSSTQSAIRADPTFTPVLILSPPTHTPTSVTDMPPTCFEDEHWRTIFSLIAACGE